MGRVPFFCDIEVITGSSGSTERVNMLYRPPVLETGHARFPPIADIRKMRVAVYNGLSERGRRHYAEVS
jgi:hypothetical protein